MKKVFVSLVLIVVVCFSFSSCSKKSTETLKTGRGGIEKATKAIVKSAFPSDGAVNVNPRDPIKIVFNKPIDPNSLVLAKSDDDNCFPSIIIIPDTELISTGNTGSSSTGRGVLVGKDGAAYRYANPKSIKSVRRAVFSPDGLTLTIDPSNLMPDTTYTLFINCLVDENGRSIEGLKGGDGGESRESVNRFISSFKTKK